MPEVEFSTQAQTKVLGRVSLMSPAVSQGLEGQGSEWWVGRQGHNLRRGETGKFWAQSRRILAKVEWEGCVMAAEGAERGEAEAEGVKRQQLGRGGVGIRLRMEWVHWEPTLKLWVGKVQQPLKVMEGWWEMAEFPGVKGSSSQTPGREQWLG